MEGRKKRPGGNPGADSKKQHLQYINSPADTLLPFLDALKPTGEGRWIARCPGHYDQRPSLSVRETSDGTLLLKCWTGCTAADVVAATGLSLSDLFPRRHEGRSPLRRGERWVPADVLKRVAKEVLIALCAAEAVRRGDVLSDEDAERLVVAASRLRNAAEAVSYG